MYYRGNYSFTKISMHNNFVLFIVEFCNPSPCVNGECTQDDATLTYSCQCNIGFTGQNCDQELIGKELEICRLGEEGARGKGEDCSLFGMK